MFSKKKRIAIEEKQKGGSPAYRLHGNLGLLSGTSLEYQPLGLTKYENEFSKHIVSTSGGGRRRYRRRSNRKRLSRKKRVSRRRNRRKSRK